MATFTVEQARQKWEQAGKAWTPEVEAKLRQRGIIAEPLVPAAAQAPSPARPAVPRPDIQQPNRGYTPEWARNYALTKLATAKKPFMEQMGDAVASLAQYVPGQYGYDPKERLETGTSSGDLLVDAGLRAGTVGLIDLERLSGDAAGPITNQAQLAMSALGTGGGMVGPLRALAPAAAMTAGRIVPQVAAPFTTLAGREAVARTLIGSGLSLGGYEALMPGSPAERLSRGAQGFNTGVALAGAPAVVGASNPVARKAVEFGAMYGLGAAQGMPADENLIQSVAMMLPAEALHAGSAGLEAASAPRRAPRLTPEQSTAAIDALESLLANERAPMQAEVSARVAPFREAQANARAAMPEVSPAEYNLPIAEKAARAPAPAPAPVEPIPEQYQRTLARIEAMRARQAATPPEPAPMPEPAPAPEPPLARTPAQMEIPLEAAPAEPRPAKETRGQRRARLQAEASAVNAEAAAKMGVAPASAPEPARRMTKKEIEAQRVRQQIDQGSRDLAEAMGQPKPARRPRGDVQLGSGLGGGGEAWKFRELRDALSAAGKRLAEKSLSGELNTDWAAARGQLAKNVDENPGSVPFSRANRGEQTFDEAVKEYASQPRRLARVEDLRPYPENATPGVKDIIDSENLSALAHDISKPVADRIDAGFTKELAQKHRGLTDPVRKTQEVYDGELASAGEMSEIHGGREIEMAAYKKAAEVGDRYRDLKTRTGINSPEQLEIAGRLLERYTSSNRGHAADDLGFVRDPENRRLLVESGNPQGMFEYVRELRRMMDEAANLYNAASRASGGEGIGDIAAYFPKVATKPKFFEIGERLARSKARKGADPRTRNTAEEVFNPRSERRSSTDPDKVELDGREVAREWNAERVFEGYIDSMLRGITGDIALSQSIKIAKYMEIKADIAERRGNTAEAEQLRIRANITRNLAQQKWNHQLFGVGARAEDLFKAGGAPGQMTLEALAANKRAFDNTKYRLNPRFNLVTQWTSVLNPTFADPVAALLALRDMGVPGMPTEAKKFAEATYEYRRKAMPHSAMRAQAEGTGSVASTISSPMSGPRKFATVAEKVFFDGLTQGIEAWANKYSALIGYHSTRNLKGLTPRQRALAAGQTVFKTQSAFTFGERAGVLNSRAVQGTWPAQGYAVELANQVREALGQTGVDSRLYGETQTQQARRAGAIVAAAVMQNLWQNLIFNAMRGKDIEESFNFDSVWDATLALPPFISILLPTGKSGRDMPNPALPIAQGNMVVNKLGRVAEKVAKGEDATEAAVDAIRYGAGNWGGPGGAFASDIMGGRYDFLLGEDEGAGNVPNTVRARPAPARPARGRPAVPRR